MKQFMILVNSLQGYISKPHPNRGRTCFRIVATFAAKERLTFCKWFTHGMKFALPCGFFIFASNKFSPEKSCKNISQNRISHSCADTCSLDIIADHFLSEFHYSSHHPPSFKEPEYHCCYKTY